MPKKEPVVIVGFGWVGQANALALLAMGYPVSYFDPGKPQRHYPAYAADYEKLVPLSGVLDADSLRTVYVVCVGDKVSDKGVQDIGAIRTALDSLRTAQGTVVLRSTVLPDLLEDLPFDYYVPEFLHEKTAVEECASPHFVVVGAKGTGKPEPSFFSAWRKSTPRQFEGTPREAAFIKYLSNLWNAVRIAFVNEFGDTVATPRTPQEVESIHRVIDFVLEGEIYQRYGRAFGGHCLPKDMRAFSRWYGEHGKHTNLLQGAYESNEMHRRMEGQYRDIPEWFSAWPSPHLSGFVALREFFFSVRKNLADPRGLIKRYWLPLTFIAFGILLTDIILFVIL